MADLGDHHRLFLQSLMCRKICSAPETEELYHTCCRNFDIEGDQFFIRLNGELSQNINSINKHIKPLHMEIRKGLAEDTGMQYYALVNTTESSISRLSSDYSSADLELFKKILEKVVLADNGVISSMVVLNLTHELEKRMSKKEAEHLLARLVEDKWLIQEEGEISLSPRTLIEMDKYLKEMFGENLQTCLMCKQIVLKGKSCKDCQIKLHGHCANRCFQGRGRAQCPRCGCDWPDHSPQQITGV
ncbi:non-structural maintenance of chromosomes element 1 homolog isoform X1 [Limulus polyphemus]|uniref:Non-structural maintenance of chromosomes element 1 homolog n=1 Tax=Limulus polyphemus TaxID=6850 RepID=A0ABM1RV42_LIMPO|nr:non-structural maintenance of chromosomes element 1 homolog isoform X1 [Limulus polyphemus]